MTRLRTLLLLVIALPFTHDAAAQDPYILASPVNHLATIFTDLYGPHGLTVDSLATLPGEQPHTAHFNSDFQFDFSQFSTALVNQIVSAPLPSPTSGFTYEFDRSLGIFQRTTRSFGPIVTDRADTIGARRVTIGFAFQRFTFDTIEGLDLASVPAVFTHDSAFLLGGREDVVTTMNQITASTSQATTYVTVGITNAFDLSVAVPIVNNDVRVVSTATVRRIGTTNPLTHFFRQSDGEVGVERVFTAERSASGIGDLLIRGKYSLAGPQRSRSIAVGVDLRVPTGDAMELIGSGTTSVQPFALWSGTWEPFSPHVNVSYRWNGQSVLAGNAATGESGDFPDQVAYGVGADVVVVPRLTLAFDIVGRYTIDTERLQQSTFQALDNTTTFSNISFVKDSFNALGGAIGAKVLMVDRLLLMANVLFNFDSHGLRDRVTPLVGLQYGF